MSKQPCTICGGSGEVPAIGGWVMEGETDRCPHCNGSGEEPEKIEKEEK